MSTKNATWLASGRSVFCGEVALTIGVYETYLTKPLVDCTQRIDMSLAWLVSSQYLCTRLYPSHPSGCAQIDLVGLQPSCRRIKNDSNPSSAVARLLNFGVFAPL